MSVNRFICRPCRYIASPGVRSTFKDPICPRCYEQLTPARLHNLPSKRQARAA